MKTKIRRVKNNRTCKKKKCSEKITKVFFEILNTIKLYSWKTVHKDQNDRLVIELYDSLSKNIDIFIEIFLMKPKRKITITDSKINLYDFDDKIKFKTKIFEFRQFLIDLDTIFSGTRDKEILKIRDEIIVDLDKFLYLMLS